MAESDQAFAEPFKRISVADAKAMLDDGKAVAIDVREGWEWANGHIGTATHTPLARIMSAPAASVTQDNVIFVCEVGQRSAVAAEIAASLGFDNLYNMEGGMTAWRAAGYPVAK
ncbi:MAG: rhodanese-like domain-containing protein [Chloroflexota bacterium]